MLALAKGLHNGQLESSARGALNVPADRSAHSLYLFAHKHKFELQYMFAKSKMRRELETRAEKQWKSYYRTRPGECLAFIELYVPLWVLRGEDEGEEADVSCSEEDSCAGEAGGSRKQSGVRELRRTSLAEELARIAAESKGEGGGEEEPAAGAQPGFASV